MAGNVHDGDEPSLAELFDSRIDEGIDLLGTVDDLACTYKSDAAMEPLVAECFELCSRGATPNV